MNWFSKVLAQVSKSKDQLTLKFSKDDNTWLVMKEYSIMFIGSETACNTYMRNFASK
ncbi:hypothetical protein [Imperialibacter roseus]|uniref:Uncharacterized protein n=1 Tax=Imperialibacter roseus TaxID=1324217 RepID=A0ABZ0IKB3_9BACT|nr:hypothetical protein [Imperialibacter roseus]WOK04976.1 hypothetical protein RT717_17995 [Imperialibacter roseus]